MSVTRSTDQRTISGYTIVRQVSDQREVYLADAQKGDGQVVLVVLDVAPKIGQSLESEVRRVMTLNHESFARIVDIVEHNGRKVIAFEHIEGTSLHRLMRYVEEQDEQLGDGAVLHIGVGLLEALNEAHSSKTDDGKVAPIVHGQLGPHQVLISWEGEVKVMGFGLSGVFAQTDQSPGWLDAYTAPEVRAGRKPTSASNVYSAGAMMWALLSKRRLPEDGSPPMSLRKARPDLPPAVAFPLDRALEQDVTRRISAKALQVGLTRGVEDADREELRWAMEVCRVRCTVEEEFLPQESFPPKQSGPAEVSSLPPDSEEIATGVTDKKSLMSKARMLGPLPWERDAKKARRRQRANGRGNGSTRVMDQGELLMDAQGEVEIEDKPIGPGAPPPVPPRRNPEADQLATIPAPAPRVNRTTVNLGSRAANVAGHSARSEISPPPPMPRNFDSVPDSGVPIDSGPPVDSGFPGESGMPPDSRPPGSQPMLPSFGGAPATHSPSPSQVPSPSQAPSGYPHPSFYPHPSYGAPGSVYPYPMVGPDGQPLSGYPYPMVGPDGQPLSGYPMPGPIPQLVPVPVKWIIAVAASAIVSFVLGLMLASSGMEITFRGDAPPPPTTPEPAAASAPTAAPVTTAVESVKPAPVPPAAPPAAPEPTAEPEIEEPPVIANRLEVRNSDEAAELAAHKAHLIVHSAIANAHVYVHGTPVGGLDQPLVVDCGQKFVRLGTVPPATWLEPGQSITIPCRAEGEITIQPRPPKLKPKSQFLR